MSNVILTQKQKDFRKEVSRLNSMANKRLRRLEGSDFKNSPAYRKWLKEGGEYFSIRGKTQQDVWKEYYRVSDFLDSKTSSITGTKEVLKNINEYTGMNLETYDEIINASEDFFRVAKRVSEYLGLKGMGALYDSGQIYNSINLVTQDLNIALTNMNVDEITRYITEELEGSYYNPKNRRDLNMGNAKRLE